MLDCVNNRLLYPRIFSSDLPMHKTKAGKAHLLQESCFNILCSKGSTVPAKYSNFKMPAPFLRKINHH